MPRRVPGAGSECIKVAGSAGQLTVELQGRGYIVQIERKRDHSETDHHGGVLLVVKPPRGYCQGLVVATAPMPTPIPTETGKLGEAGVLFCGH